MSYLDQARDLARAWDDARPRTQQTEPGWSDMAGCRAYLGFKVRGDWPTDHTDNWRAEVGTWMHDDWTEIRRADLAPRIPRELIAGFGVEVSYGGVPGHLDEVIIWPDGRWEVTDWKFPDTGSIRLWNDDQFLNELFIQPNGYAAGLAAEDPKLDPDNCIVRLLGMPVDGTMDDWVCHERPFNREVADTAIARYADVQAAVQAGEELPRDKPFWFCDSFCEYVGACRGFDRHEPRALPEITDPFYAAAIEQFGMAKEIIAAATKTTKELDRHVRGLRGTARGFKVFPGKPQPGRMRMDEAAVEILLGERGIPVHDVMVPGEPPKPTLTVTRVKSGGSS
jgi:hypothetical protein